ncbi:Signal transduction histidine kinase [Azospirillum sp. RU38E]|nr:Signal transduction histidine kinase [Azospirillum sp. RU38E]SNT28268.1 Signal transduction histidine kinase [Azospirillum sp. RU37A]
MAETAISCYPSGMVSPLAVPVRRMKPSAVPRGRAGINLLCVALFCGLWLLIGWQIRLSYADAVASAERDTGNLTRAFAQHVTRTLSQVQQLLMEVADRVAADQPLHLDQMRRRVPGMDSVSKFLGVLDGTGRVLDSTRTAVLGMDFADSDYFQRATAPGSRAIGFGKPIVGRSPLMSSIPFWVRVEGRDGTIRAVVVGDVLSEYFSGLFSQMDLDLGGVATLLDMDGTIYARGSENRSAVGATFPGATIVRAAREKPRGVVHGRSAVDGTLRITSYERLEGTGLVVAVGYEMQSALRGYRIARNQMLAQGLIGSLLLLLLALLVNRYILRLQESEAAARAARAEAEHASAVKSQFLAVASHELRTPLNAIIGFAEVMASGLHGPLGHPRYAEYADDIHKSGLNLLALINDTLDLAKIEAGRMELHAEPVDVRALSLECVRMLRALAAERGVELGASVEQPVPALVADTLKLRQILLNLLTNAVKNTDAGGAVRLSALADGPDHVLFRVADTGCGMTAEEVALALEPFRQVHSHLSRDRQGTGLGLPVAQALVALHRGSLSIDSQPDHGTLVTVRLPARPEMIGEGI